jgi:hypothetical protein
MIALVTAGILAVMIGAGARTPLILSAPEQQRPDVSQ